LGDKGKRFGGKVPNPNHLKGYKKAGERADNLHQLARRILLGE